MRTAIIGLAAAVALAVAAPATAATQTVNIYGWGFSPRNVTVTEGDTVVWVNKDNDNHQILSDKGQFVSAILRPSQSYQFTFSAAGTYGYKDELRPRLRGTIYVKGAPPSLSFAVSAPIVTYGQAVTVSGTVSNKREGESVNLYYRPYPQPNMIQLATVITGPGGVFSYILKPQILTTYQAGWKGAFSAPATVEVAPKVSLGRNAGWIIHVSGGHSFAGRGVQFQRLNPITGQWVTLRKVILNARSSAKVIVKLPKGVNRLRVGLSVNQAGAGYLGTYSPTVTWRVK